MNSNFFTKYIARFFTDVGQFLSTIDWLSIVIFMSFFLLVIFFVGIRDVAHKDAKLIKHFNDRIYFKSYIRDEFYVGVRRLALKKYDKYDDDFVDKEIALYNKLDQLVFKSADDCCYLSESFCDYISTYHPEYRRKDFSDAVIKYRRYYELQMKQQSFYEQKCFIDMRNSVSKAIRDKRLNHYFKIGTVVNSTISESELLNAYKRAAKDLKANNFVGLMPRKQTDDKYLLKCLADSCIIPHDKIVAFCSDIDLANASGINTQGIIICYDTFSDKYFIDSSDHMIETLAELFSFDPHDVCSYSDFFRADMYFGHKIFVKLLSLSGTGYTDINALCNDLIDIYDSAYPNGYNVQVYDKIG